MFIRLSIAIIIAFFTTTANANCLPKQLNDALDYVRSHFGKVTIISDYRARAKIAGTNKASKHARCLAVDFNVYGQKKAAVAWLNTQPLEVITYGGAMHHIHIAIGSYKAHHKVNPYGIPEFRQVM